MAVKENQDAAVLTNPGSLKRSLIELREAKGTKTGHDEKQGNCSKEERKVVLGIQSNSRGNN